MKNKQKGFAGPVLVVIIVLLIVVSAYYFLRANNSKSEKITTTPLSHLITTIPSSLNGQPVTTSISSEFVFNGDGTEVIYSVETGSSSPDQREILPFTLMKNDRPLGDFLYISNLEPSADGHSINYAGLRKISPKGMPQGGEEVINDIVQSYGSPIQGSKVVFSNDGKHYAYETFFQKGIMRLYYDNQALYEGSTTIQVINGKAQATTYIPFWPTLNSRGDELAVISQVGLKKQTVLINPLSKKGTKETPYDNILSEVVFSPNSAHWAYRAQDKGVEFIIVDGNPQTTFPYSGVASSPIFSNDSKKIKYTISRIGGTETDKTFLVDTGKETSYTAGDFSNEKNNAEVKMDTNLAEKGQEAIYYLEVNGIRLKPNFSFISKPQFDSTGKLVSFGVRDGNNLEWLVYEIVGDTLVKR